MSSSTPNDNLFVLLPRLVASCFVSENTPVSATSIFSDAIWHMASMNTLPGTKRSRLYWDFSTVPGFPSGFALSLAEYAFARLFTPDSLIGKEATWLTVHNELCSLRKFSLFCHKNGLHGFHQIDTALCKKFLRELQREYKSKSGIRYEISLLYRLWDYRTRMLEAPKEMPFGRPLYKLFGHEVTPVENATPVIPEHVYSALMSAAIDYVLKYGETIVKLWNELREYWTNTILPKKKSQKKSLAMLHWKAKRLLRETPATWLKQTWSGLAGLYAELHQLRRACTLVIFAYSGIRTSELLSLEAGCYVADEWEDGTVRQYINTRLHKHRERGSKDTWVVIEEVVVALRFLESLTHQVRIATGDKRLFLSDGTHLLFYVHRTFDGLEVKELTSDAILVQLEAFQRNCDRLNRPAIPDWVDSSGKSRPWKLNARQFRRTLARFIVRQPFGVIAGMLQYKHVEVATFQGYAGEEPAWNQLLEQEKVLASVDILEEVAMDLSNGQLAGDFGQQLKDEFAKEFRGRAEDYPPSQIAKWLAHTQRTLFIGKFNFCFFDSATALCLNGIESNAPVLNFCQPESCTNACIAKRHVSLWKSQLNQAEDAAAHPKASAIQRRLLAQESDKLRAVISAFGKGVV
ncbi:integrase family protein [Burkholderia pseudomallei]|nr:integrase family protein [Burkholderia pseudomallei]